MLVKSPSFGHLAFRYILKIFKKSCLLREYRKCRGNDQGQHDPHPQPEMLLNTEILAPFKTTAQHNVEFLHRKFLGLLTKTSSRQETGGQPLRELEIFLLPVAGYQLPVWGGVDQKAYLLIEVSNLEHDG